MKNKLSVLLLLFGLTLTGCPPMVSKTTKETWQIEREAKLLEAKARLERAKKDLEKAKKGQ